MAMGASQAATAKKKSAAAASSKHAQTPRGKSAHATAKRRARVKKPAGPSYQLHPDQERYQQIQRALADRGYFKGQADGNWNDDSVDALKRFQTDLKLDSDGKINALTLTGLGLGPKHDGTSAGTVPLSATESNASNPSGATAGEPEPAPDVPAITEVPQGEPPTGNEPQ